jgi:hypothetical protein
LAKGGSDILYGIDIKGNNKIKLECVKAFKLSIIVELSGST